MSDVTTDTTVIVKGLIPPRRKKKDEIYDEYLNLHRKAKNILLKIERGIYNNHIPLISLIETVCVVARLTNDYESVELALSFVSQNSELYSDAYLLEKARDYGLEAKFLRELNEEL